MSALLHAPRHPEPEEHRNGSPRVLPWLIAAVVAGTVAFLLAPNPWPAGEAVLVVEARDATVRQDVTVGSTEPRTIHRNGITVSLPSGVATDEAVVALVATETGIDRTDPPRITLELPDGRSEAIPVLRTEEDGTARAERRPPSQAAPVLVLLAVVVVLWVSEVVPLFVTSMAIPVVLVLTNARSAEAAIAPFAHPIIALFFGGYLMAEAMRRAGLDRRIARTVVAYAGSGPVVLYGAVLGLSAFLSMWMSNTAAVAVLIPIALAVTEPLESPGYRRVVILGLAYAATIGGAGSLIGTPANPLAATFLDDLTGTSISFARWFGFGLPLVVLLLPVIGAGLWWRAGDHPDPDRFSSARLEARHALEELGPPSRAELTVAAVFAGVVLVWLTQEWHGLSTGIVAVGGAVVLAVLGRIRQEDLGRISWASLLTFGGGLSLGLALTHSGVSDAIAAGLSGMRTLPSGVAIGAVALVTLLTTTVASNTATAATFVPLAIPLAALLGVDPVRLVVTVALASSIDFALVVGTPPTMLAYSTGLFSAREILRTGAVYDLVGIALLVSVVPWVWELVGVL